MARRAILALLTAVPLLSGCITPEACIGLEPTKSFLVTLPDGSVEVVGPIAPKGDDRVQRLKCHVARGYSWAQLELGKRYELGFGVPRDNTRAADLYREAATPKPAQIAIYSPPVTPGGVGQVMFLANPNAGPGEAEAQYRLGLMHLDARGVRFDINRARALFNQAAAQGFAPAVAKLRELDSAPTL
jgi:TPR repeat protein